MRSLFPLIVSLFLAGCVSQVGIKGRAATTGYLFPIFVGTEVDPEAGRTVAETPQNPLPGIPAPQAFSPYTPSPWGYGLPYYDNYYGAYPPGMFITPVTSPDGLNRQSPF